MYLAHLQVDFRAFLSLVPGSPAASAATLSSPTSCPISCTCSCPSSHSTSLLYTTKPSFEETTSTGPPESSYHVSYNEEQGNGHSQSNQLAGQAYQQQPTNTVVSNPTLGSGTLFYKRPQEESQETTVAPEVTPYIQSNPSYSKPFTSFSTSSPAPTSASPPSFPPQVNLSLICLLSFRWRRHFPTSLEGQRTGNPIGTAAATEQRRQCWQFLRQRLGTTLVPASLSLDLWIDHLGGFKNCFKPHKQL